MNRLLETGMLRAQISNAAIDVGLSSVDDPLDLDDDIGGE